MNYLNFLLVFQEIILIGVSQQISFLVEKENWRVEKYAKAMAILD